MKRCHLKWMIALCSLILVTTMLVPSAAGNGPETIRPSRSKERSSPNWGSIEVLSKRIEIPPGENFFIYFDNETGTLVAKDVDYTFEKLPAAARNAVDMVPDWLKENLTRKFIELDDSHATTYGDLITGVSDKRYMDEVAFAVAHSSKAVLQNSRVFPSVFEFNAEYVYKNDPYLKYANLTEVNDPVSGDYTTVTYTNRTGAQMQLPKDIYYWFVVHPKISDEMPSFVNPDGVQGTNDEYKAPPTGKFWREWLFHHSDPENYTGRGLANPLLKDMLENATDVWQALSAISNWVVDSIEFTSDEERAVQPVRIYRKHIGRCGEHQDIAAAAARAALIPTVCTSNIAEDHVWNEFWEGRWVHWDANSRSNCDNPEGQDKDFNGGKDLSAVWSWRGDGYTWSVADKYTLTSNFTAHVQDSAGNPVDGAEIWILTENFYDNEMLSITTWGTTDSSGRASFELGNVRNYWSSADSELGEDPPDQGNSEMVAPVISGAQTGGNYSHNFNLPGAMDLPDYLSRPSDPNPQGRYKMNIGFNVTRAVHTGKNLFTGEKYHTYDPTGMNIDMFMSNQSNFDKYGSDVLFDAFEVNEDKDVGEVSFITPKNERWYAILSNEDSLATSKVVNFTVELFKRPDIFIRSPEDGVEVSLGESVTIEGSAFTPFNITGVNVSIDKGDWVAATDTSESGEEAWSSWEYVWDPRALLPGKHGIRARMTDEKGHNIVGIDVTLVDDIAPSVSIGSPANNSEFHKGDMVSFKGSAIDNMDVTAVEFHIQNNLPVDILSAYNGSTWDHIWDTTYVFPGTYNISVEASDKAGNVGMDSIRVILRESTAPFLEVTAPEDGAVFETGAEVDIEGTAMDSSGVSGLTVVVDGDADNAEDIYGSFYNGNWDFELDSDELDLEEGGHNISVRATDMVGNNATVNITIYLDSTKPNASFSSPSEDEVFSDSEIIKFHGSTWDNYDIATLEFIVDDSFSFYITPYFDAENDYWEYNYDPKNNSLPSLSSGEHTFKIKLTDSVGHENMSLPLTLTIDAEKPEVTIVSIPSPVMAGNTIWLNGTASDDVKIEGIEITVGAEPPEDISKSFSSGKWSYQWTSTSELEGEIEIVVRVSDGKGGITVERFTLELINRKTDTDNDGMVDWWELKYGLDRKLDDRGKDPDGDGANNIKEYLGQDGKPGNDDWTDPTDPTSFPRSPEGGESEGLTWLTGGVMTGIFLAILGVGLILVVVLIVVKKRKKKRSAEKGYEMWQKTMLDSHKEKERFRYEDEEDVAEEAREGGESAVEIGEEAGGEEEGPLGGESAIEYDESGERGGSAELLDDDEEWSEEKGEARPLSEGMESLFEGLVSDSGGSHTGLSEGRGGGVVKKVLPAHLDKSDKGRNAPTCPVCGTSASYRAAEDRFWCDNCRRYMSEDAKEVEKTLPLSGATDTTGVQSGGDVVVTKALPVSTAGTGEDLSETEEALEGSDEENGTMAELSPEVDGTESEGASASEKPKKKVVKRKVVKRKT